MNNELRKKGWTDMSQQLDAKMPRKRRRVFAIWWLWGLGLFLLLGMGWWFFTPQSSSDSTEVEPIAQTHESSNDPVNRSQKEASRQNSIASVSGNEYATKESQLSQSDQNEFLTPKPLNNDDGPFPSDPASEKEEQGDALPRAFESAYEHSKMNSQTDPVSTEEKEPFTNRWDAIPFTIQRGATPLFSLHKPILTPAPLQQSTLEVEPEKISPARAQRFFLDFSAGARTARPYSYVTQLGIGSRHPMGDKFSLDFVFGGGVEGLHQESVTSLKEWQASSSRQDSEFAMDPSNFNSEAGSYGQASLRLQQNYFGYLGASMNYSFTNRWSLRFGLDFVSRIYTNYEGFYEIEEADIGSGTDEFLFNSRQIKEQFQIFNRWDIRPHLGLHYAIHHDVQIYLNYRHGFSPVLAHPTANTPSGQARYMQMGIQYAF